MLKVNDKVKIIKTGEVGYIDRLLDSGERLMVRIPASDDWAFPHHIYVDKDNVHRVTDKPEPKKPKPIDWRAPL